MEERNQTGIEEHRLLRVFLEDAEELLERLNASLLALERDTKNPELINEVFRLTHSLKSEAALVGFGKLSSLAHRLEDVFEKIRGGQLPLERPLMDSILSASDLLHELTGRISRGEGEAGADSDTLVTELERLAGLESQPEAGQSGDAASRAPQGDAPVLGSLDRYRIQEALDRGERVCRVELELDPEVEMRYLRAYLVFNNLETAANVIATFPDLTIPGTDDGLYARFTIVFTTGDEPASLTRFWDAEQITETAFEAWSADTIRDSGFCLDPAADRVYPGALPHPGGESHPIGADRGKQGPGAEEGEAAAQRQASEAARPQSESTSVRVDTKKLTEIRHLIGDLITWKTRLSGLSERASRLSQAQELSEEIEQVRDSLERITGSMQQAIMETSMVPIAVLFNKFPRLVRDLSRKLGKEAELKVEGGETEIDRSFVEVLSDPLTHLIRNALDHGIEPVQARLLSGKPAAGAVTISAQQLGGKIVIEVVDDGRGLDVEAIRRKSGASSAMSDEAVIQHIFSPGFSTKEDVTDLSGRGVGMDVVATRIRGVLKGEVQVRTEPGRGTRVTIFLPLSLTILEGLVVRCRGYFYAISVRDIEETVKIKVHAGPQGDIVRYRSEEIPALRLERLLYRAGPDETAAVNGDQEAADLSQSLLGYADTLMTASGLRPRPEETEHNGVVIRHKDRAVCLLVDQLVEEEEIVIKPVSDMLNNRGLFSGVSLLGDGRIVFILNTVRLVALS